MQATSTTSEEISQTRGRTKRRILHELNKKLTMSAPLIAAVPTNFTKPKAVERWTFNLHGKPVQRIIIYLRSDVGCQYGVRTGGCTGCRHWRLGTAGARVDLPDMYIRQYEAAIAEHGYPPVVCIYNEGNMLNEWELPQRQLHWIVRDLEANGVQRVVLESRVEYMTPSILGGLRQAAEGIEMELGIGLESVNNFIRNELFLKSLTLRAYEEAVKQLRSFSMRSLAYVILKPAFLNEAQALRDTVNTIHYAFSVGTDAVSVEPIGVEPHTVNALLERAGHFKPAWLWSVIRVAQATRLFGEVRLGGFQFMPLPKSLPQNCPVCTEYVLEAISRYNSTYDISELDLLSCDCCQQVYERYMLSETSQFSESEMAHALAALVDAIERPAEFVAGS